MAQGIKACRRLQMGKETTPGEAAAATTYWRGVGTIQDGLLTVFPQEDIGILPGVDRSYIPKYEALLTLESTPATFQQLPYLFEMGIASATPTTDTGSASVYTYTFPTSCTDIYVSTDLATYTWEGGDNAQAEEFAYGFLRSMTLSGVAGEALMMSAEIVGRQVSTTDFTADQGIPTVTEILFSKGSLCIDDTDTNPATSQISNEFLTMDLSITSGWVPVYTADGSLYFSFVKQTSPEVILTITFEYNTSSIAEIANWRAGTARVIRLQFDGDTGDKVLIDMAGKWDNFQKLGERDGNDVVQGTFRARYNDTATLFFVAAIYCATIEALP